MKEIYSGAYLLLLALTEKPKTNGPEGVQTGDPWKIRNQNKPRHCKAKKKKLQLSYVLQCQEL